MEPGNDEASETFDIFREPTDYYPPERPATFTQYRLSSGINLELRLVGQNPLWGHLLWNAGQVVATYLQDHADALVKGKSVLELGAGAGLPSLVASILGARVVVATDYPDVDLIENLNYNIQHCTAHLKNGNIVAQGFLWGNSIHELQVFLGDDEKAFDLLILADVLFNHSEHQKLLKTVRDSLKKNSDSRALVFFTPYRPWLLQKDLQFFEIAQADGFLVEKVLEHTMDRVMFENDPGDEELRKTVFGYALKWKL